MMWVTVGLDKIKKIYYQRRDYTPGFLVLLGIFIAAFFITCLRRPDIVLYPQFWAEDGAVWFAEARSLGWVAIGMPVVGYLQTISRLVGLLAQIFPVAWGPAIFNIIAVALKISPVVFLFSARFQKIVPNFWTKILLSFLYLSLPNSNEIFANITNTHSYLALLVLMVLVAAPARTRIGKVIDVFLLLISGLSGPFVVFLAPLMWISFLIKRRPQLFYLIIISICAVVQGILILFTAPLFRSSMTLGATPALFFKIISGQIFISALIGQGGFTKFLNHHLASLPAILVIVFLVGIGVLVYTLIKARWELKLFIIFSYTTLLFALIKPMASTKLPQWQVMSVPGNVGRYWFFPMLAFVFSIVWLAGRPGRLVKVFAGFLLLFSLYGLKNDFFLERWPDLKYQDYARRYELLIPGEKIIVPIMPSKWSVTLIKK